MSFFKKASDLAMKGMKAGSEMLNEAAQYEMQYQNYSDDELVRIFKTSSSFAKRGAAAKVWRSRHGSDPS